MLTIMQVYSTGTEHIHDACTHDTNVQVSYKIQSLYSGSKKLKNETCFQAPKHNNRRTIRKIVYFSHDGDKFMFYEINKRLRC